MMPPTPGMDPTQQKMMMFLPLFMTAFMLGMPAGLSLYYFINALCGFAQQLAFMRERTT
jgi:YidC/Oxa1 family membrane protein insertase